MTAGDGEQRVVVFEPGRWLRVLGPDNTLWCETSDKEEAVESMRPGDRLQRDWVATLHEWRDESPDDQ